MTAALAALSGLALAGAAPLPITTGGARVALPTAAPAAGQPVLAIVAVAMADGTPRVFIASDSTAQDYGFDRYPQAGWGTMLRCAFDAAVSVDNRAVAARSTRTFIGEGRLDEIARTLRAGDTLLIQFGHNDANAAKPERFADIPAYRANLLRFIAVARGAGAQPILLTPVTRRTFADGKVTASFPAYSAAVRALAAETGTPLIDLDALSARWVEAAGAERSRAFYLPDDTHFTEAGARGVAELVAAALARLPLPVAAYVRRDRRALAAGVATGDARCDVPAAVAPLSIRPGPEQRTAAFRLPEGNYRVTMQFGPARDPIVRAEGERLMLALRDGARGPRSFVVNIRTPRLDPPPANAPGADAVRIDAAERAAPQWDDALSLAWSGGTVRRIDVAPAAVPMLFLLGDSTVADQAAPYASWGGMLPAFIGPGAAVANHARSGATLKSFLAELRLDKVLATMRPGDVALIQFGHNDQKAQWPQTYAAAATTYRAYLRAYVAEVRLHGGTAVLVTPPERRTFQPDGHIRPTLADQAAAMRAVADADTVPLIDLNAASIAFYEALGPDGSAAAFVAGDATHHASYGAYELAAIVADALRRSGTPAAGWVAPGPRIDPARPDPLGTAPRP